MFKINLIEKKEKFKMPVIFGIDFAAINWPLLIIILIIGNFLPSLILYPLWESSNDEINKQIKLLNAKHRKVSKEVKSQQSVQGEAQDYQRQIKLLEEKTIFVQKIIEQKVNPKNLLERIARTMPEDLWLKELIITKDKMVFINGESLSYKSIGSFLSLANESVFFQGSLKFKDSKTVVAKEKNKKRIESFKIEGAIKRY